MIKGHKQKATFHFRIITVYNFLLFFIMQIM